MRFRFMAIVNLRTVKIVSGVTLHHQSLFTVKSLINVQISYPHKIKFSNTEIIRSWYKTKIRVLMNVNMEPEISYDTS